MALLPGDLVKLLSPIAGYPVGTTARVSVVLDGGNECRIEFDDGRQLLVAATVLAAQPWSSLGSTV